MRPSRSLVAIFAVWLAVLLLGRMLDTYVLGVATTALVYASLAAAWHLVGGYLGQISIGHSGLFGAGAYLAAMLGANTSAPVLALVVAGALGSTLVALAMAPSFRARGMYFAIATLGVTGLLHVFAVLSAPGGNLGVVMPFRFAPHSAEPYYWSALLFLMTMLVIHSVMTSKHGVVIRAVRDDEEAAGSLGANATRYKVIVLLVSAALTGAIGAFYAVRTAFVDPDTAFDVMMNVRLLLMAILGGMGTLWGPVIGAIVITIADEVLRVYATPEIALMLYATLLLVLVLWFPAGLSGVPEALRKLRHRRGEHKAVASDV